MVQFCTCLFKGALLSGLIQNGSDCALKLREAAGASEVQLSDLKENTSPGSPEMKQQVSEQVENETLTSDSDDEFLDCEEGDESL